MGACANCSLTDRLFMSGEVVLFSATSYLLHRLEGFLDAYAPVQRHHATLSVQVPRFKDFVQALSSGLELTDAERNRLHLAHLAPGEGYGPDLLSKTRSLAQWARLTEDDLLLDILRREALAIHFQPIVDLRTNSLYGFECLTRGINARGDLVPPGRLLDTARHTDMLFNLDRLMREKALRAGHAAQIKEHLFINFVPTAVYNPNFCLKSTVAWVESLQLDPTKIIFEVVETEAIQDNSHLLSILKYYRACGFKIALDDVAAGYSGLLQLLTIRPDIMKIDRQVIDGIHADAEKQSLLRAMMGVARD